MTHIEQSVNFIRYSLGGRTISLSKEIVDRYSDIVCPVNERFLSGMIKVFGKSCSDDVMSYKIGLDMAKELQEYA